MAIVDERGRVFGRWNLVDAVLAIILLGLIPLAYGAYALFRPPVSRLTAIEPAVLPASESVRVTVRGENLRPYMRVSFNQIQGGSFLFADPSRAEVDVIGLPPGTYDVILYDHAQERFRLPKAFTVQPLPQPITEVELIGSFAGVLPDLAKQLVQGLDLPGLGQIKAVGKPLPAITRVLMGEGRILEVPTQGAVNVPSQIQARCRVVARGGGGICVALDINLMPEQILTVPTPMGPLFFQIDQVRSSAPTEFVEVRVRAVGARLLLERVRPGDRDLVIANEFAQTATVLSAGPIRSAGQLALSINVNVQGRVEPVMTAGEVAERDITLRVPVQRSSGGWTYAGRSLRTGGPLTFKAAGYEVGGILLEVPAPR